MKTLQLIDKQKRKFRVGKTEFVYQKDKKCTQSKIKIMSKYELQPCIRYFNIGEIEVSIDLTEKDANERESVRQANAHHTAHLKQLFDKQLQKEIENKPQNINS